MLDGDPTTKWCHAQPHYYYIDDMARAHTCSFCSTLFMLLVAEIGNLVRPSNLNMYQVPGMQNIGEQHANAYRWRYITVTISAAWLVLSNSTFSRLCEEPHRGPQPSEGEGVSAER